MKILNYLNFLKFFILINLPISIIGTFLGIRDYTTYLILIPFTLLDLVFILSNLKKITIKKIEVFLILLLIISFAIGICNTLSISRRHLTDFTNPFFFILKIIVIRKFLSNDQTYLNQFINQFSRQLFISGFISILIFYFLSRFKPMYAGITPTTHPFFIIGMIKNSVPILLSSFFVVLLSGKRALLLSSLIIFIIYQIVIKKKGKLIFKFALIVVFGSILFSFLGLKMEGISALEKYKWTIETIQENKENITLDSEILNVITAGRLEEVNGATKTMNTLDYFVGKGVGFTYTYTSEALDFENNEYSNLHFTPLSIISKYGIIFFIILFIYITGILHGFKKFGNLSIFFGLYVLASLIDMLFAYTIFVDPLIPLALGYLSNKNKLC